LPSARNAMASRSLGVAAILSLVAAAAIAVWQGVQAREESARAVAARDFMLNIFQRADQEKSRGATVTARDLLETGRKDVMTRLAGQPKLQAELLQGIAKIQAGMGEYVSADSTYEELVRIFLALGRPREAAMAAADHADNAIRRRDLDQAGRLAAIARSTPGRPLDDVELNARLNEVEGWIAQDRGDVKQARELLSQSQRGFAQALGPNHLRTFDASRKLAQTERALRNFDGALALYESLERSAINVQGLSDKERAGLDWEHVDLMYAAGDYARALAAVDVAEPRCVKAVGADQEECRLLTLRSAVILLRLGWADRALDKLPRIKAIARDLESPYARSEALLLGLRIEALQTERGALPPSYQTVRQFGESGGSVTIKPIFKATALLALAEACLRTGRVDDARGFIEQALALVPGGITAAIGRSLFAVVLLDHDSAERGLEQALLADEVFRVSLGAEHPMTQLFSLNRALALDRVGRHSEALALVKQTQPILERALGRDAPTYLRVVALRARLERASPLASRLPRPREAGMIEFFS